MTPISLGIFAAANQSAAATSFESIATTTVGAGGSSTVTLSSIPSTYTHLQLRIFAQTNRSNATRDVAYMRLNSDTGSNYSWRSIYGLGSAGADSAANAAFLNLVHVGSNGYFGAVIYDILDYANTNKNKTVRALGGLDDNTAGGAIVQFSSGAWYNTTAVNSITLYPANGTQFNQYSSFALYGIKAAV